MPQRGPLSCGAFDEQLDSISGGFLNRQVERFGDAVQTEFLARVHVRARVEDEIVDAQSLGALNLVVERLSRLPPLGVFGTSQIDQVGVVGYDRRDSGFLDGASEL